MFDNNQAGRIVFTFGFAIAAFFLLVFAFMVDMPMRAILIAVAVSNIIFLLVALLGDKLPFNRR